MSRTKEYLMNMLYKMTHKERVKFFMKEWGMTKEDAVRESRLYRVRK